jgi:predicted dienelactone hydrolase
MGSKLKARCALLLLGCLCTSPAMAQDQAIGGRLRDRLRARMAKAKDQGTAEGTLEGTLEHTFKCTNYKIANLDVAVWKPQVEGKAPLVVFSHGFGGKNTQTAFLMKAMAQAGYLVVAPNHNDANFSMATHFRPQENFTKVDAWSDKTYIDRQRDIVNLLEALHKDPSWDKQIDWSEMALCGHSLGGYTVLGLAGAWPSWKIAGVKGVIALSPYTSPLNQKGSLNKLNVPVMYQGGTRDTGCTPSVKRPGGAFSKTGSPAYFVEFDQFTHFTWTDFNRDKDKQDLINYYCIAFLDKYVKGKSDTRLEIKLPGVSELETK